MSDQVLVVLIICATVLVIASGIAWRIRSDVHGFALIEKARNEAAARKISSDSYRAQEIDQQKTRLLLSEMKDSEGFEPVKVEVDI